MFTTEKHSLEFWMRLQNRFNSTFEEGRKRLAEYRGMVIPATVADADMMRNRAAAARVDALRLLTELENLRLLMMAVEGQLRYAAQSVELPFLESQMACLRDAIDLYRSSVCGLPQRQQAEEDLADFARRFDALKNAGNGEASTTERQRLRDQCVALRVLGREDSGRHEDQCRGYETSLDHLATRVQQLKSSTLVALQVPDNTVSVLAGYGVQVFVEEQPALPAPDAPAGDEAGEAAEPAIDASAPTADAELSAEPVPANAPEPGVASAPAPTAG